MIAHLRERQTGRVSTRFIYLSADLATWEARDAKGLYKKAHIGEVIDFTRVSSPYEDPINPNLSIDTGNLSLEHSISLLIDDIDKTF